jgi:hypothetical protein
MKILKVKVKRTALKEMSLPQEAHRRSIVKTDDEAVGAHFHRI